MKPKRKKSEHATVLQRVQEILTIRLLGAEFWDIRQYAAEMKWRVSIRQLHRYVAEADKLMAEALEKDRGKLLARHLMQRRTMFARAMEIGDFRGALAIAKDEAELQGLYPGSKPIDLNLNHAGTVKHDHGIDPQSAPDILRVLAECGALAPGAGGDGHAAAKPVHPGKADSKAGGVPVASPA